MTSCQDQAPLRTYGGVRGSERRSARRERFIDAGLELLGTGENALTVRGVCKQAGLAARYFYESFTDRSALEQAVYDHVVGLVAESTLAAVAEAGAGTRAKVTAGVGRIIGLIGDDPRLGRLLFSTALAGESFAVQRGESARLFAGLLGQQAREHYGEQESAELAVTALNVEAEFAVGGFAQVLTAWLEGGLELSRAELVAHCTELFLRLSSEHG
ncbi:TetR/AcrR family transcriptional regulator [Sciscionella marina]|uniref:TetR/AcrR family transcriptional regulator n=1 Tax=Sciscionella marina TaxID=508770 RepID=UPI0003720EE3|nr:TetR/AcrR family transcriptional regulator [Sciscionella marina]